MTIIVVGIPRCSLSSPGLVIIVFSRVFIIVSVGTVIAIIIIIDATRFIPNRRRGRGGEVGRARIQKIIHRSL